MTGIYERMKTKRKWVFMDHLCPHHSPWDAFYACSHFIEDASGVQCLADLPTGTQLFPGGSRVRGYCRPLIPNLTCSTAPSWGSLQNRVSRPHTLLAESEPPGAPGVGLRDIGFIKATRGFLTGTLVRSTELWKRQQRFSILTCCLGKEILL